MPITGRKKRRRAVQSVVLGERLKMAAAAARIQAEAMSQGEERAALLAKAKEYELAYLVNASLAVNH
jgi:hypothetical protein